MISFCRLLWRTAGPREAAGELRFPIHVGHTRREDGESDVAVGVRDDSGLDRA